MSKKNIPTSEITPEIILEWKKEFGKVHKIEVADKSVKYDPYMVPAEDDAPIEGALVGYLSKPTDKQLGFAMSKLPAVLEAGKVILKNCWLGGDDIIKTDTALLSAAALQCVELLEVRQAQLKEA